MDAFNRYVVITPVRDEEEHLERTIQAVIDQTIRPAEWVIVDDGSTDRTPEIIDRYASQYSWIRGHHRTNRGFRKAGGGVVEAFYEGFERLICHDWNFVVKLDGDLSFEPDYFERILERFRLEPRLGIAGGTLYCVENGEKKIERNPKFHVRGATKVYRRKCWEEIHEHSGHFRPSPPPCWRRRRNVVRQREAWANLVCRWLPPTFRPCKLPLPCSAQALCGAVNRRHLRLCARVRNSCSPGR